MRCKFLIGAIALAAGALPVAASAAPAYTLDGAEIFAGPGEDYPVVAQFGAGVMVDVDGCLADRSWCDVSFAGNRGWVYAGDLAYGNVSILQYGPSFPLPTVTFSLGDYWGRHYRGRPFYSERQRWEGREHTYRADEYRDRGNRGYENRRYERRGNEFRGNDFHGDNEHRGNDEHRRSDEYRGNNEHRGGNDFRGQRGREEPGGDRDMRGAQNQQ